MRINFILPTYPWRPSGGYAVVYQYANRLIARGHQVTVIHSRKILDWTPRERPDLRRWARRVARFARDRLIHPTVAWQTLEPKIGMIYVPDLSEKHIPDADATVATAWLTAEMAATYGNSKGDKFYLVMDFHPYLGPRDRIEATWKLPMRKISISTWLHDQVVACDPGGTSLFIPIGIDNDRFRCLSPIPGRPKSVCMYYSEAPYKAPRDGVKAMEIARAEIPSSRYLCFGARRRPASLPSWIEYHPHPSQAELVQLYNGSAVFISSSLAEGFALPVAEAMACGCAAVCTDNGGNRDYSEHNVTALVSPPGEPLALARNLIWLLRDDDLRIRMAEAGRARIGKFTWDRSAALFEKFLLQHPKR